MSFSVVPIEEADIPRVADIMCEAIAQNGTNEFQRACLPDVITAEGRVETCTLFKSLWKNLPANSDFLKVVDDRDGSIVAFSVHIGSPEPPRELSVNKMRSYADHDEELYAMYLRKQSNDLKLRLLDPIHGPITEVLVFYVDPRRQREGIGTLLMDHLLDLSLARGATTILIAVHAAEGFYNKQKFRTVEDHYFQLPEKWQHRPQSRLVSMIYEE